MSTYFTKSSLGCNYFTLFYSIQGEELEQMSADAVTNMAKVHDDIKTMTEDMREIADALQIGRETFLKNIFFEFYVL